MKYWTMKKTGLAATLGHGAVLSPGTQEIPSVEIPEVGERILIELQPWGMARIFDPESDSPSTAGFYVEVEVKGIKKAKISYE